MIKSLSLLDFNFHLSSLKFDIKFIILFLLSRNEVLTALIIDNEKLVLQEIAEGNEVSFRILFDAYKERLFCFISGFIKSEQHAEEIVMDIFIKLWKGRALLPGVQHVDSFLFRIARNKAIDFLRDAANDSKLRLQLWEEIEMSSSLHADNQLLVKEFEKNLTELIGMLPPRRKQVYQMSCVDNITHDEIAEQLKISKATVNNHIVKAKSFIRTYLSKRMDITMLICLIERF